jgi:hypothetical protein
MVGVVRSALWMANEIVVDREQHDGICVDHQVLGRKVLDRFDRAEMFRAFGNILRKCGRFNTIKIVYHCVSLFS